MTFSLDSILFVQSFLFYISQTRGNFNPKGELLNLNPFLFIYRFSYGNFVLLGSLSWCIPIFLCSVLWISSFFLQFKFSNFQKFAKGAVLVLTGKFTFIWNFKQIAPQGLSVMDWLLPFFCRILTSTNMICFTLEFLQLAGWEISCEVINNVLHWLPSITSSSWVVLIR